MVEPDLGEHPVEPMTALGGGTGNPLVFINDHDAVGRPAQLHGEIDEGVLPSGRFPVVQDLLGAGLSHIDNGQTGQMMRLQFGGSVDA